VIVWGMRKLIVTQNITLDGVIDAAAGWFSPGDDTGELAEVTAVLQEQAAAADALLLGRISFEEMRGFWPHQTDDTTGNTEYLNQVRKYVVSSTLSDPEWNNTTVLAGPPVDAVRSLKHEPGADIVVTGSIMLVHELIAVDLVDEYRLFVYSVVIGCGRRLFQDAANISPMTMTGARRFGPSIALLTYSVAHPGT
jgi:dihydrofolate reductase